MTLEPKRYVNTEGLIKEFFQPDQAPSARSIARLRRAKLIPYMKFGGLIFYNPADVLRAMEERMTVKPRGIKL